MTAGPETDSEVTSPPVISFLVSGDNRRTLRTLADNSIDSVVTDPPYGLGKEPDMTEVLTHWLAGDDFHASGGGFMGKCLHPDTELLTDAGWKPVPLVSVGDAVCALNPGSGEIEYVPVAKTHEYDFDGELLRVGGRSCVQVVTPNHRVWTDRGLVRADELPSKFKVSNQGEWRGRSQTLVEVEGKEFGIVALFRFFGLWLGDGYVCHRVNQPWKQDFIGFSVKKPREIEAIRSSCQELGVRYTETPGDRVTTFYVYDKSLLAWLSQFGGAHNKFIPSWIFQYDAHLLEHLYLGMMDTDGTRQGNGQHVYYTVSDALADDFQRLCLHTGRSATKTPRDAPTNFGEGRCWTLSVLQRPGGFWMERDGRSSRPQPAGVQPVPHTGRVHCVTLDRHHVMMSRYDGRMAWTGNSWDSFVPGPATWKEVYRVLKPGGHLVVFSGTRTWDLATLALRLAGFEIRDGLMWMYGQGFPKSMDVSKAIDKAAGAERAVRGGVGDHEGNIDFGMKNRCPHCDKPYFSADACQCPREDKVAITDAAQQWNGWGTALKPAWEPIVLARKPLVGTVAANVLAHGTGALNIDASRIATTDPLGGGAESETRADQKGNEGWTRPWMDDPEAQAAHAERVRANVVKAEALGRFPANVILSHTEDCVHVGMREVGRSLRGADYKQTDNNVWVGRVEGNNSLQGGSKSLGETTEPQEVWECVDDCPVKLLDGQVGVLKSGQPTTRSNSGADRDGNTSSTYGAESRLSGSAMVGDGDQGGASRFFYKAKVSKAERNAGMPEGTKNDHPTVKPIDLMAYLARLITPPGGVVLDPFCGSGSTGVAAHQEGLGFVGLDDDPHSIAIAQHRMKHAGADVETLGKVEL